MRHQEEESYAGPCAQQHCSADQVQPFPGSNSWRRPGPAAIRLAGTSPGCVSDSRIRAVTVPSDADRLPARGDPRGLVARYWKPAD
jgi:hypothetical protein